MSESDITAIRTLLQSGFPVTPHPYLQKGERIAITKGPLRGVSGFFVKNNNNAKVVVSIELLQRSVAVELDYEAVRCAALTA